MAGIAFKAVYERIDKAPFPFTHVNIRTDERARKEAAAKEQKILETNRVTVEAIMTGAFSVSNREARMLFTKQLKTLSQELQANGSKLRVNKVENRMDNAGINIQLQHDGTLTSQDIRRIVEQLKPAVTTTVDLDPKKFAEIIAKAKAAK